MLAYDTRENRWQEITPLPQARRAAVGAILGDTYIVTGGYSKQTRHVRSTLRLDFSALL